jgi:hypothetical protein
VGCCAAFDEAAHKLIKQLVQHTSRRVGEPEPSIARVATPTGELLRKVVVFKVRGRMKIEVLTLLRNDQCIALSIIC